MLYRSDGLLKKNQIYISFPQKRDDLDDYLCCSFLHGMLEINGSNIEEQLNEKRS